jgi:hypothetical protein
LELTRSPTLRGATGGGTRFGFDPTLVGWSDSYGLEALGSIVSFEDRSPIVLGATGGILVAPCCDNFGPLFTLGMTNSPDVDGVLELLGDFFAAAEGAFRPTTGDEGATLELLVVTLFEGTRGATGGGPLLSRGETDRGFSLFIPRGAVGGGTPSFGWAVAFFGMVGGEDATFGVFGLCLVGGGDVAKFLGTVGGGVFVTLISIVVIADPGILRGAVGGGTGASSTLPFMASRAIVVNSPEPVGEAVDTLRGATGGRMFAFDVPGPTDSGLLAVIPLLDSTSTVYLLTSFFGAAKFSVVLFRLGTAGSMSEFILLCSEGADPILLFEILSFATLDLGACWSGNQ